jgi:hypothetical protein
LLNKKSAILRSEGLASGLLKEIRSNNDESALSILWREQIAEALLLKLVVNLLRNNFKLLSDTLLWSIVGLKSSQRRKSFGMSTSKEKPPGGFGHEPNRPADQEWYN